jgi:hypothetical protein
MKRAMVRKPYGGRGRIGKPDALDVNVGAGESRLFGGGEMRVRSTAPGEPLVRPSRRFETHRGSAPTERSVASRRRGRAERAEPPTTVRGIP